MSAPALTQPAVTADLSSLAPNVDPSIGRAKCKARTKRGPCKRYPSRGATVCRSHGAGAPQVQKAAARRLAAQEALSELVMLGEPVEGVDPSTAVLNEISHAAGYVLWLRDRVRELNPAEIDQGATSPWMQLFDAERDRLVRWSDMAVRMGLETRRIALAEQTGGLVVGLLRAVLAELNLTPAQHAVVAQVVPVKLRELTAALTDGN